MKHISVPVPGSVEIINMQPSDFSPLISKCEIKVCYVSNEPNRNKTVITKEKAKEMAPSLRGSIIAGFYNEEKADFEGHNKELSLNDKGEIVMKSVTRPYGFVDLSARCWFQDFVDDGKPHTYLMTEGWLWTGEYPECRRILKKGNGQSMELDEKNVNSEWSKDYKTGLEFFIINEAIISKLCILGDDVEPCFEGASIQGAQKVQYSFSLDENFKDDIKTMMFEFNKYLGKGGEPLEDIENVTIETVDAAEVAETVEDIKEPVAEPVESTEVVAEEPVVEQEEATEVVEMAEATEEEDKLEAAEKIIAEFEEKVTKLEAQLGQNQEAYAALDDECAILREFKLNVEKQQKEDMINSFYMLSDEDKKDVIENIDKYSLDDIEAKLSIICVRNRVGFDEAETKTETASTTFSLGSLEVEDNSVPAWIKAVQDIQKNKI